MLDSFFDILDDQLCAIANPLVQWFVFPGVHDNNARYLISFIIEKEIKKEIITLRSYQSETVRYKILLSSDLFGAKIYYRG